MGPQNASRLSSKMKSPFCDLVTLLCPACDFLHVLGIRTYI